MNPPQNTCIPHRLLKVENNVVKRSGPEGTGRVN